MGLGNLFHHKNEQAAGTSRRKPRKRPRKGYDPALALPQKGRGARQIRKEVGRLTKGAAKKYKLLASLHPGAMRPDAIVNEAKAAADARSGAVRAVKDNQGQTAYTAIMITDGDLTNLNLTPKSDMIQDMGADLQANDLTYASMILNIADGQLAFIPDEKTIKNIRDNYTELAPDQPGFMWAIIPDTDDMQKIATARVWMLENSVNLKQLEDIMNNDKDLRYDQNTNTIVIEDNETAANNEAAQNGSTSETASDDATGLKNAEQPSDQPVNTPIAPGTPEVNEAVNNTAASTVNNQISADDLSKLVQAANGNHSNNPANSQAAAVNNNQINTQPVNNQPADNNTNANSDNDADSANMAQLLKTLGSDNDANAANNQADNNDSVVDFNQLPEDSASADETQSGEIVNNQPQQPNKQEYTADVAEIGGVGKSYVNTVDKELNLVISYKDFDQLAAQRKPITFKLQPVDGNDELGKMANTFRDNYNSQLASLHNQNEQKLRSMYGQLMQSSANRVVDMMSSQNNRTSTLARREEAAKSQHAVEQSQFLAGWEKVVEKRNHEYNQRKEQFAEAAKQQAAAEYDTSHLQHHQQQLNVEKQARQAEIDAKYTQEVQAVKNLKIETAKHVMNMINQRALAMIADRQKQYYDQELEAYQQFNNQLQDLLKSHYEDEQKDRQAKAQILDFKGLTEKYKRQINQLRDEMTTSKTQLAQENEAALTKAKQTYQDNLAAERDRNKRHEEDLRTQLREAQDKNDQLAKEYHQNLRDMTIEHQSQLEAADKRADDAQKASDSALQRSRKGYIFSSILIAMTTLSIGTIIGHSTAPTKVVHEPAKTEQSTNNNSKQSPVTIYNTPNGASTKESSSKNSESNAQNTNNSTQNDKSTTQNSNNDNK